MNPFSRDGHLTDLGLELFLAEELDDLAAVTDHLDGCAVCRDRVEAAREDEAVPLPPRRQTPPPANRPWPLLAVGLAVAAVLLVVANLPPIDRSGDPDGIRVKGRGLALEVIADDPAGQRPLTSGQSVHPGDRLGFRVGSASAGHLMVLSVDAEGVVDPCFPQSGGRSVAFGPTDGPAPIPEAVRLDETLGEQRFVALRCEEPFALEDVREALAGGTSVEGCAQREVVLDKVAP